MCVWVRTVYIRVPVYTHVINTHAHTDTSTYTQDKIDELDLVLFHNIICCSFHLCRFIGENGWLCIFTMMERTCYMILLLRLRPPSLCLFLVVEFHSTSIIFWFLIERGQLIYIHQKQCHHFEWTKRTKGASTPLPFSIYLAIYIYHHTHTA